MKKILSILFIILISLEKASSHLDFKHEMSNLLDLAVKISHEQERIIHSLIRVLYKCSFSPGDKVMTFKIWRNEQAQFETVERSCSLVMTNLLSRPFAHRYFSMRASLLIGNSPLNHFHPSHLEKLFKNKYDIDFLLPRKNVLHAGIEELEDRGIKLPAVSLTANDKSAILVKWDQYLKLTCLTFQSTLQRVKYQSQNLSYFVNIDCKQFKVTQPDFTNELESQNSLYARKVFLRLLSTHMSSSWKALKGFLLGMNEIITPGEFNEAESKELIRSRQSSFALEKSLYEADLRHTDMTHFTHEDKEKFWHNLFKNEGIYPYVTLLSRNPFLAFFRPVSIESYFYQKKNMEESSTPFSWGPLSEDLLNLNQAFERARVLKEKERKEFNQKVSLHRNNPDKKIEFQLRSLNNSDFFYSFLPENKDEITEKILFEIKEQLDSQKNQLKFRRELTQQMALASCVLSIGRIFKFFKSVGRFYERSQSLTFWSDILCVNTNTAVFSWWYYFDAREIQKDLTSLFAIDFRHTPRNPQDMLKRLEELTLWSVIL
jgi:hypothetical protein